jgi:SAM-dependent methyltransferase
MAVASSDKLVGHTGLASTSGPHMFCPACDAAASLLFEATDLNRGLPGRFPYYRCTECALVFIASTPANLGDYYVGGYQKMPASLDELRSMAQGEAYRLDSIPERARSGKLLEIGPWIGLFSCAAKDAGFDVTALEINASCVEFLRTTVGIRAIQSSDPSVTLSTMTETFQVIVLWHSIEHLPQPWETIKAAADRLTPGGIMVVAAPNPESAQFLALKERWYHLDAPRHLYLLPPSLIEKLATERGLKLESTTTSDRLGRILDRLGWHHFVGKYMPIPGLRRLAKLFVTPLLTRFHKSNREGMGAGYTLVFRKP